MENKSSFLIVILLIISLWIYFLPSIIARKKRNALSVFLLNLFLGITFLGWVIALVWSVKKDNYEYPSIENNNDDNTTNLLSEQLLNNNDTPDETEFKSKKSVFFPFSVFTIILILIFAYINRENIKTAFDKEENINQANHKSQQLIGLRLYAMGGDAENAFTVKHLTELQFFFRTGDTVDIIKSASYGGYIANSKNTLHYKYIYTDTTLDISDYSPNLKTWNYHLTSRGLESDRGMNFYKTSFIKLSLDAKKKRLKKIYGEQSYFLYALLSKEHIFLSVIGKSPANQILSSVGQNKEAFTLPSLLDGLKKKRIITKLSKTQIFTYYKRFHETNIGENYFYLPALSDGNDSCILVQIKKEGNLNILEFSCECD